jgi:RNA polymerase sigma-70 factor (ECF subfamily)
MESAIRNDLPNEGALIAAAKRDPAAFGVLYQRHAQRIYQYLRYRSGLTEDVEELTAQTFLRALEYLPRYQWNGAPFVTWLYRIANSLLVSQRRRPTPTALPDDLPAPPLGPGLEEVELRQELWKEYYRLPEVQQHVLLLRFVQDLSYDEIAEIMGRTPGALRQLAYRAVQTLRERMGRS